MGALTENHKCPRGPLRRVTHIASTVAIGGAIGIGVCLALNDGRAPVSLMLAAAALGAVLAAAVRQAVGGRP
jgi:hypothetical protein